MNQRRIGIQQCILEEADLQALAQVNDKRPLKVILAASPGWQVGVVGIVAGRLKEKHCRPAIVCGMDEEGNWRCSGRSVSGYDIGNWLRQAKTEGLVSSGGGHPMAGGLRFSESQRPFLHTQLNTWCELSYEDFKPNCEILARAESLSAEDWQKLLRGLAPFGQANLWRPIFLQARLESVLFHNFKGDTMVKVEKLDPEDSDEKAPKGKSDGETERISATNDFECKEKIPEEKVEPKSDAKPELVTGRFWTDGEKPKKISVTWKDVDRARREWRIGQRYTLELEVRGKENRARFVVLNSWKRVTNRSEANPRIDQLLPDRRVRID